EQTVSHKGRKGSQRGAGLLASRNFASWREILLLVQYCLASSEPWVKIDSLTPPAFTAWEVTSISAGFLLYNKQTVYPSAAHRQADQENEWQKKKRITT
ncbi:MAG: hypothetical protein ACRD2O_13790, partial [Terriglobia bacterium]